MRYHYERPSICCPVYGEVYTCNHPIYSKCTLFVIGEKGLAVIQQRFDPETKHTYWTEIDPWLNNDIYIQPGFKPFFDGRASLPKDGIYPTVSVRQIMWALKMKPIARERWETYFDRKEI